LLDLDIDFYRIKTVAKARLVLNILLYDYLKRPIVLKFKSIFKACKWYASDNMKFSKKESLN